MVLVILLEVLLDTGEVKGICRWWSFLELLAFIDIIKQVLVFL